MQTRIALLLMVLISFFSVNLVHAEIKTEEIKYRSGDTVMKGYIAYDASIKTKRPAVLVVHEWWGHNDFARKRAKMLAEEGFTALAVDMYGNGKKADHPKDAKAFSSAVKSNMDIAEERFSAAVTLLKTHPTVNKDTMSAIGYCFGGGIVLEMIRRGVELDLAASFHGSLTSAHPAIEESLKNTQVMIFNGANDKMVKHEHVISILNEMTAAKADLTLVNYPDTLHAFTNPDADIFAKRFKIPLKYNQKADEDSWSKLIGALNHRYSK